MSYFSLQVMKITRYICLLVIFPIIILFIAVMIKGVGPYGGPLFSITYCGVLVPVVKIIENTQLRKFARPEISLKKCFFNYNFECC